MKWIGKHPVFSDLLIGGVLLAPPDNQYSYELTLPNDDGSAGQVLSTDGSGVLSWVANGVAVPNALTIGTGLDLASGNTTWTGSAAETLNLDLTEVIATDGANRVLTSDGDGTLSAEATLTFQPSLGGLYVASGAGATSGLIINTDTTDNAFSSEFRFWNTRGGSAGQDNDELGTISFHGNNDGTPAQKGYNKIIGSIADASTGSERGKLDFQVMEYDGTLTSGLSLTGMDANGEVDVTIAAGAASTTAIAGELTLGVDLAVSHGGTGLSTVGTNYLLTGNGTSALSAESGLQYSDSSEKLTLNGTSDVEISSDMTSGYDVVNYAYGSMHFNPYNVFGTGVGNLLEMRDFTSGSVTGASFAIKGCGAYGTNKAGGNIEVIAGRGTGSAAGGQFRFWSSPAGSTGSSYNTTALKFTVDSTGDTTVYGDLTVTGGDITIGSTAGEVVSTGQHILKQTKVTIDQAGCNALNSSPQTLVAAQGANKIIIPVEVTCLVDNDTTADTSGGDLIVGWNGTTTYTYALKYARRWMYGITTDMTFVLGGYAGKGAASLTGGENVPLTIATSTGMTTNSLTSMTVYTSYYVIDNS